MSTIDERVVEMKFNNSQFESGVRSTMSMLDRLKNALKFGKGQDAFADLNASAKRVDLNPIQRALTSINERLSTVGVIGAAALWKLADAAMNVGQRMVQNMITPMIEGFQEYELQINSVQTILANTMNEGTNIKQVNAVLDDLNLYADKTIYNFSEMTRNIGTFTAAGVKLEDSRNAIKGIANLAALSGSNSQQASTAMYQLSQAIAAGTVKLMDWNSVVNAGMGGQVFQDALKETARVHGIAIDDIIAQEGSFRESLSKGWLSSEILLETLSRFTGDLNEEQLRSMGYSEEQIAASMKLAETANNAATKIKSFTQLIETLGEAAGSGWADTFRTLIGDFEEAKELWTNINDVLEPLIRNSANARNEMLKTWSSMGGRHQMINALFNTFKALGSILSPIGKAFREIFPPITATQLLKITAAVEKFTQKLILSENTMAKVQRVFRGIFAVVDIVRMAFVGVAKAVLGAVGGMSGAGGTLLDIAAGFGDLLWAIRNTIKEGTVFEKVGAAIGSVLRRIGDTFSSVIQPIKEFVSNFIDGFRKVENAAAGPSSAVSKTTKAVGESVKPLRTLGDWLSRAGDKIKEAFKKIMDAAADAGTPLGEFVARLKEWFSGASLDGIVDFVNKVLLGTVLFGIRGFISDIRKLGIFGGKKDEDEDGGLVGSIKGAFESLTDTLDKLQKTISAQSIITIALAVGILTLSITQLSKIDAAGLTKAMTAISLMIVELGGFLKFMTTFSDPKKFAGILKASASLILVAVAVRVLAGSVEKLGAMDWKSLVKGLGATIALVIALAGATKLLSGNSGPMMRSAAALVLLAAAVSMLAPAVKDLGDTRWKELVKGLGSVVVLIAALAGSTKLMSGNTGGLLRSAVAITALAFALKTLAPVVKDLGDTRWKELVKGLGSVVAVLAAMAAFMKVTGNSSFGIAQAAGVLAIAAAITMIGNAVTDIGALRWQEIVKGLGAVGAIMLALGLFMRTTESSAGSILAAAGILIVAQAIKVLSGAISVMGALDVATIAKGLMAMAGSLLMIGIAMAAIPPTGIISAAGIFVTAKAIEALAPPLERFGQMELSEIGKSLLMLAGSLTILGIALYAFSGSIVGAAGMLIVAGALNAMQGPLLAFSQMELTEIGKSLLMLAGTFTVLGVAAALLSGVILPLMGLAAAITLIGAGIGLAGAGILAFSVALSTLAVVGTAGITVLIAAIESLLAEAPKIGVAMAAGFASFVIELGARTPEMLGAVGQMLLGILQTINQYSPQILDTMFNLVIGMGNKLRENIPTIVAIGADILIGFLNGLNSRMPEIINAATNLIITFVRGIRANIPRVQQEAAQTVISFINSTATTIRRNSPQLRAAGWNLGMAIIDGMTGGLASKVGNLASQAASAAGRALSAAKSRLGIKSPSREFRKLGVFSVEGLILGLGDKSEQVGHASERLASTALSGVSGLADAISESLEGEMEPVITPVLDLTKVETDASKINSLFDGQTLDINDANLRATSASMAAVRTADDMPSQMDNQQPASVVFNQNNYSPEALPAGTIYRNTRGLIAQLERRF